MRHVIADILTMKSQEKVKYGKFLIFFQWIMILLNFSEYFSFFKQVCRMFLSSYICGHTSEIQWLYVV